MVDHGHFRPDLMQTLSASLASSVLSLRGQALRRACALLLSSIGLAACGHQRPLATTDGPLALQRVVLYRNGVGYFERQGQVDDETLSIRVRRDQVDDLLKSLTIVDRSTGKAKSVSMPLDPEAWLASAQVFDPGEGSLARVLDGLRGSEVVLETEDGHVRGRIVMVETIQASPPPGDAPPFRVRPRDPMPLEQDHKITLLHRDELRIVRLSQVRSVTLAQGDLALQLHRRLDASAGEGMFQQIEVDIRLAGAKKHDLVVSYVVEAPMWKPTYRVVLPDDGKGQALLQGWAVVDNTSGEDWSDVNMSLTSGAPIAFAYDLHTPRTVERADLTESGVRKVAQVAIGETTYDEAEESMAPPAEAAPESGGAYGDGAEAEFGVGDSKPDRAEKRRATAPQAAPGAPPPRAPAPKDDPAAAIDMDALRQTTVASAQAKRVSGLTRFDLQEKVTVPNGTSTMVAILNETVEAEETFLYRPGGAGTGYEQNPYRVVRFRNETPFVLEPGPISIYSGGSFVGEGLSEAVSTNTSATIPFAVEPTILVTSTQQHSGQEMHLVRIARGVLEVETFSRKTTTWQAKGQKSEQGYTVYVRHPKAGWNYELTDAPKGTETLSDAYLVPVNVPAQSGEGQAIVLEQTPSQMTISIWDTRAPKLLEELLVSATVTPELRATLQPVVELRREIGRIDTEIEGLQRQQQELDQRANEVRENLSAIKKDAAAGDLRRRLNARLEEFTSEADRLGRRIVELQSQRLDRKIKLEDLLQNLTFERAGGPAKR